MEPIETIIAQGESETLELKPSFNQDVIETAAVLANHSSVAMSSCRTGFLGTPRSLCFWITTRSRVREARPTTINKYAVSIVKCSKPRNRLIAQAFYDMGMIEQYGSGIKRVIDACLEAGLPEPEFESFSGGFQIVFKPFERPLVSPIRDAVEVANQVKGHDDAHDEAHDVTDVEMRILKACRRGSISAPELLEMLGYKTRTGNFKKALRSLTDVREWLEMTIPDKPTSRLQKYRLTEKGRQFLKERK